MTWDNSRDLRYYFTTKAHKWPLFFSHFLGKEGLRRQENGVEEDFRLLNGNISPHRNPQEQLFKFYRKLWILAVLKPFLFSFWNDSTIYRNLYTCTKHIVPQPDFPHRWKRPKWIINIYTQKNTIEIKCSHCTKNIL